MPYGKILREYVADKPRYLTTQHERDAETGLDYRGARFYDADVARFLSLDPLANNFPAWSAYNYVMGNPVMMVDPDGRARQGDYYRTNGTYLGNDGENDNKVYEIADKNIVYKNTIGTASASGKTAILSKSIDFENSKSEYIGEAETSMTFTGSMNATNSKQADGQLNVIQSAGGKNYQMASFEAVGGPWGNGSPENGSYSLSYLRSRSESGMKKEGVGFSLNMDPNFKTGRTDLRVHPDGGKFFGTQGCIGLLSEKSGLKDFLNIAKNALSHQSTIPLNVNIKNNPNNNGYGKKTGSNGE